MFKKILVPLDLEHNGGANKSILDVAEENARLHNAEMHVLTVVPPIPWL